MTSSIRHSSPGTNGSVSVPSANPCQDPWCHLSYVCHFNMPSRLSMKFPFYIRLTTVTCDRRSQRGCLDLYLMWVKQLNQHPFYCSQGQIKVRVTILHKLISICTHLEEWHPKYGSEPKLCTCSLIAMNNDHLVSFWYMGQVLKE